MTYNPLMNFDVGLIGVDILISEIKLIISGSKLVL